MTNNNKRPVFLNIAKIHMPVMAVMSIGHRITGVLMFLAIPYAVYLLDLSLKSPEDFKRVTDLMDSNFFIMLLILLIWIFAHHFFAGIRYLLIDIDIGVDLNKARITAWIAIVCGIASLFVGAMLLL